MLRLPAALRNPLRLIGSGFGSGERLIAAERAETVLGYQSGGSILLPRRSPASPPTPFFQSVHKKLSVGDQPTPEATWRSRSGGAALRSAAGRRSISGQYPPTQGRGGLVTLPT